MTHFLSRLAISLVCPSALISALMVLLMPGKSVAWSEVTHRWITTKALQYLEQRGLWDPSVHAGSANLVQYGNRWADAPWMGRPENPGGRVFGVRDRYPLEALCGGAYCFPQYILATARECHAASGSLGLVDLCARATLAWRYAPNEYMGVEFRFWGVDNSGTGFIDYLFGLDSERVNFATDNLFHYGTGPLLGAVRLFPFHNWSLSDRENNHLENLAIYRDMSVGVSSYGPMLLQLARKFFAGSWADPSLDELPFVAYYPSAGLHNGRIYPDNVHYDGIQISLPPTYLGGMPFTCAGVGGTDQCNTGAPTWPIWVPESYDASTVAAKNEFVDELERFRPGRNTRAALVYLGWAAHMIQDGAMPHHAMGWTGELHAAIDSAPDSLNWTGTTGICDLGDTYGPFQFLPGQWGFVCFVGGVEDYAHYYAPRQRPTDEFLQRGLDDVFGTAAQPRSRKDVCDDLSIHDQQIVPNELSWEPVAHVFQEVVERARLSSSFFTTTQATLPGAGENGPGYLRRVRDAIHGTMKLLACVQPHALSPALTLAALSPLG